MIAGILFGFVPLAIWLAMLLFRNGFWLLRERDTLAVAELAAWPSVVAVVPARDEADVIARSIGSLIAQDYPGDFHIVLVDDQSGDGTADLARALNSSRLTVLTGAPRPMGWTGKLWAMQQGSDHAATLQPEFLWFTDADIAHSSDNLRQLVARAQDGNKTLVSLMARLSCATHAEHFLIPAFVFFFDMLFPFGAVNNPRRKIAAAAGGCMLARRSALDAAGGIKAIRHNIIDDCALGRAMKAQGPIWLGLTDRAISLRPYNHIADIRHMVSRSAYAQLGYSPLVLAGTVLGLLLVYVAPVMTALFAWGVSQLAGWLAWIVMAIMFQPILRFYRLSPLWGLALPLIGAFMPPSHWSLRFSTGRARAACGRAGRKPVKSMSSVAELQSGKDHTAENFPVASFLIAPKNRPPVMAFYKFVRAADDVADSPVASADEKLALLEKMRASLVGENDAIPEGVNLRQILAERGLSPVHALDLLEAFRRDCTKLRYRDWDDLIDYCRYSAMPVGRFVLDVHGESTALWPANDALCAALQVINHLQDCAKDYCELDRVYIPEPLLSSAGVDVAALAEDKANPALVGVISGLARRNAELLEASRPFARAIRDGRLALEVDLIQTLADDLNTMLMNRDPLSQTVHHSKTDILALFLKRFPAFALMRLTRKR